MTRDTIDILTPGWSNDKQWRFFGQLLPRLPDPCRILMLGVYFGRDIAYILSQAANLGRSAHVTGVDLFTDVPGADWTPAQQGMTWRDAHGVEAPSYHAASSALSLLHDHPLWTLVQSRHTNFLTTCKESFDAIYIDLSHDYQTTADAIRLSIPLLAPHGILCGDDYSDGGTWGVKRAVEELLPGHQVHDGWIWSATKEQFRSQL